MSKITYLFGAGASANTLPIVKDIPARIQGLIDYLENEDFKLDTQKQPSTKISYLVLFSELIADLKWMLEKSAKHSSIDTFAKKLMIIRNFNHIKILKISLSIFFILEQVRVKPDFRYDTFFASIIDNLGDLPNSVRIVSWNYDSQFELTYSEFLQDFSISKNQKHLNLILKNESFNYAKNINKFTIFKLNGTTGFYAEKGFYKNLYHEIIQSKIDTNFIIQILNSYAEAKYSNAIESLLSFAWERESNNNESILNLVITNIKDCEILIIIGYSFPFFNRDIDREILSKMEKLKRVYIQAPDANIIKERFQAIREDLKDNQIFCKYDVEQFFLPNEI
jgi:hypothetical protein